MDWISSKSVKSVADHYEGMSSLRDALKAVAATGDRQQMIDALVVLHTIKSEIASIFSEYQASVAPNIPSNEEIAASNGQLIQKRFSSDRKGWQHKDLLEEVYRKISSMSVDMDTGEVTASPAEIAAQLLDYVQPSYWRIKELSKLGINADHYCEVEDAKVSISIKRMETK
jgi:hypothetical protein